MTENDEIARLRAENSALRQETQRLQQRIDELEAQVKALVDQRAKTSRNSSKPPSSDGWQRKTRSMRPPSEKKPGGQPGHPGHCLPQVATPDTQVELRVESCPTCQHCVSDEPGVCHERRQVFDLPMPRIEVTEYQVMPVCCPHCGTTTTADFPPHVTAATQYGERVRTMAIYLHQYQFVPYQRVAEALSDLGGCRVSAGRVVAWVAECAQRLLPFAEQVQTALQHAAIQHNDETGLFVNGTLMWLHAASTAQVTRYFLHPRRGFLAMQASGTLTDYQGVSGHDGWKSYEPFACQHALCHAHLLRELLYLAEQDAQPWAIQLRHLFLAMKHAADEARARGATALRPGLHLVFWRRYWDILDAGWQLNPPQARAGPGRRGKVKQSAATNLLIRLRTQADDVLRFIDDLRVPFDNNLAERDIRPTKVQQKVSGGFRSVAGGESFCRIRGFISTLRKQGRPVFDGLLLTLRGACLPAVCPS